ncbi:MAG TPA: sulfite exporter TauE/SafE family protein [Sulfurovum sp.]|nr:sulfite exporter TauE/SafE family protein [Sulfurovum sp.]
MIVELGLVGILVGILSGFFGIGGGTVSVPILMYLGFDIKQAIGISVFQMLLGSFFAFFIHKKQQTYDASKKVYFGYGGVLGAIVGAYLVKVLNSDVLGWFFLSLIVFTLIKLFLTNPEPTKKEVYSPVLYIFIGGAIGVFSGMLGVGGSILMTPVLVSFLGFSLKKASAVGLFFVLFSSASSFVSLSYLGMMEYTNGLIVGLSSLVGVWIGIKLLNRVKMTNYKRFLVLFYVLIFLITANKVLA